MIRNSFKPALGWLLLGGLVSTGPAYEETFELPPIHYSATTPRGPVARLQIRMDRGEVKLARGDEKELLRELLGRLQIPEESQVLVFSKTSLQNERIHPQTPRAIYFNEETYLGWVPGGLVEVASLSPDLGMVFYALDPSDDGATLHFERRNRCLDCHAGSRTEYLPGLMVRSVFPDAEGVPLLSLGSFLTTPASPLSERWGGWYVTGQAGGASHLGNRTLDSTARMAPASGEPGASVRSLEGRFDVRRYLRPTSDIVALMVLEHQCEMHNQLNRAAYRVRLARYREAELSRELGEETGADFAAGTRRIISHQASLILRHLLFCDEIELPNDGIDGDPAFQDAFGRNAPRSGENRSLRDFQLLTRLFKYRCSYMIYSLAFDQLPPPLRHSVLRRLQRILSGREATGEFAHLSSGERQHIHQILIETHPAYAEIVRESGP